MNKDEPCSCCGYPIGAVAERVAGTLFCIYCSTCRRFKKPCDHEVVRHLNELSEQKYESRGFQNETNEP